MKVSSCLIVVVIFICQLIAGNAYAGEVDRAAKTIQVDGYLIEWPELEADTCDGIVPYIWDAVNTSAGLTGYIKYSLRDSCNPVFSFNFSNTIAIPLMAGISDSLLCGVDTVAINGDTSITYEWVVPWRVLQVDGTGRYFVSIVSSNGCHDSKSILALKGERFQERKKSVMNRKILGQFITIILLLSVFVVLQVRARKLYKKK